MKDEKHVDLASNVANQLYPLVTVPRIVMRSIILSVALVFVLGVPAHAELDHLKFLDKFVAALQDKDSSETARLVQENPKTARAVQRSLEDMARDGGDQMETMRRIANELGSLLGAIKQNKKRFKKRVADLPKNEQEILRKMILAFNNKRDLKSLAKIVWENPVITGRLRKFMIKYAQEAGRNESSYLALGQIIGELLDEIIAGPDSLEFARGEPSPDPILRLETGAHTGTISSIDVDSAGRILATASLDKTIRLWDLPSGRMRRVLRFPIGRGSEGKLFAVALSSDGTILAAGGNTGVLWDRSVSIYVFNTSGGQVIRRLTDLTDGITHLAFSPDGSKLAVTLAGKGGVRVYNTLKWHLELEASGFPAAWVDFSLDGRMIVVSRNSSIRLYRPDLRQFQRRFLPAKGSPHSAVFSPDGENISVGYKNSPRVDVLGGHSLELVYTPDISGVDNGNLANVTWSEDGRFLFAGGEYYNKKLRIYSVRRWSQAGRGKHLDIPVGQNTITSLVSRKGGEVIYSTSGPIFGAIDAMGRQTVTKVGSVKADFRSIGENFLVSPDGSAIRFGYKYGGERPAYFSIRERTLVRTSGFASGFDSPIFPPPNGRLIMYGLDIKNWFNRENPKLGDKSLRLKRNETSRSLAIAPDGRRFLLGTEWYLRLFDARGRQIWRVVAPGAAWGVNITRNGKLALAAFGDGTIRWYRMEDGEELLGFFPHKNGKEWVVWTPDGYYMSSPNGDNFIGWHINNGKNQAAVFYKAVQFERILYRPDYVRAYFRHSGNTGKARNLVGSAFFDIRKLASIAPPRIDFLSPNHATTVTNSIIKLKISVDRRSLPMRDFTVFVNSIPVTPFRERDLSGSERDSFVREVEVPLFNEQNAVRVEVFNGSSMGVAEMFVQRTSQAKFFAKGDLYLLAIGVNRFPNVPGADLEYASQDAETISRLFKIKGNKKFENVFVRTISDGSIIKPSRNNIVQALEFLKKAKAEDTAVLFLASHGISDSAGNYYFVPTDGSNGDVKAVLNGRSEASTLIKWETFFKILRSVSGKRLLIVDTCQAKKISGTMDLHSLAKRSAASSFALLAASKANEESQEYPPGRHGLFTYSLIGGLFGAADSNRDRKISLTEAFNFSTDFVKDYRTIRNKSQSPQLIAPASLRKMELLQN